MKTRAISSTEAQNRFGRLVESATQEHIAYIVRRRDMPQVVIIGVEDLQGLLQDHSGREEMGGVLREVSPAYGIGVELAPSDMHTGNHGEFGNAQTRGRLAGGRP